MSDGIADASGSKPSPSRNHVHYVTGSPGVGETFLAKIIAWRACQANQRAGFDAGIGAGWRAGTDWGAGCRWRGSSGALWVALLKTSIPTPACVAPVPEV